jgi:hypothetical protein
MGIETGAETRPTVPVRGDLGALAVDVFVACQRATIALQAAEQLAYLTPCRGHAQALAESRREVAALAEAHALLKALAPHAEALAEGLPGVFAAEALAARPLAVIRGGRA